LKLKAIYVNVPGKEVQKMKTKDVKKHFGGVPNVAKALGISCPAVYMWGEDVPRFRAYQIESITKGELTAVDDDTRGD
jgi:hypothetical protein